MGSKRGPGEGAAVLDLPEEPRGFETERRGRVSGGYPAPAGALQRGSAEDFSLSGGSSGGGYEAEEKPYVPRRGSFQFRFLRAPGSMGGRIVLGVGVFGVLAVVGLGVAAVRYALLHDERFVVPSSSDIQITGNEHLTRAQVLTVFGADLERNIFKVPLAERRADLERLPWVEHATVMRLLPHEIRVQLMERVPVAFVRQGTQIGLVDATGVLLDMPPEAAGDPKYSFPVLTGLSGNDPMSTRAARMEVYRRFMKELDSTGEHLSQTLSEVDVSNPEDVKALIASGGTDVLVHFGDEQFLERYKSFEQHLPEWRREYPKLASADMRYEQQIVLEMQKGTGVPLNGDGSAAAAGTSPTGDAGHADSVATVSPSQKRDVGHPDSAAAAKKKAGKAKAAVAAKLAAARKPAGVTP